ncbi:MAG: MerR family transcriptional regulator [Myxococcota bacterium]|nr:MerR family transcriptional regulator [Myxococcota bacterium]
MAELRMRDVMERTGLSRQAIHFYVEEGLVDRPVKTGKTMGYYSDAHVERILLIKKLQEEHFLPLKAIRAMLDDKQGDFTRAQQQVLRDVKVRLPAATTEEPDDDIALADVLEKTKLARREVTELERAGMVEVVRGRVSTDHAWLIELWAEVRAAGFTRELGFGPDLLAIFERGIDAIFEDEKQILLRLAAALPAPQVAAMVERALPLVHSFLVRLHQTKVRSLFTRLEASS